MPRTSLRVALFLCIGLCLSIAVVPGRKVSAVLLDPIPAPTPVPVTPPWYSAAALDEKEKAAEEELSKLGTETAVDNAAKSANEAKQSEIIRGAAEKNAEFDKAKAALDATKGEITQHEGRCHNGKLEPGPYQTCLTEHGNLNDKYSRQATTHNNLIDDLTGMKQQWETLAAQNAELQKQLDANDARTAELKKQVAMIAELREKMGSCNHVWNQCHDGVCSKGFQEALKHCYSVFWDGADAGLPPLPDNPRLPFFAEANSGGGDASAVDTRGVKKMTEAERAAELAKPGVQRPKGRGSSGPPPPPKP